MNFKKNILLYIIILFIIIIIIFIYKIGTSSKINCLSSGGGWAPVGPEGYGPIDCQGKRLSSDSKLVEHGFTCYCHIKNTCWDGNKCVPIQK